MAESPNPQKPPSSPTRFPRMDMQADSREHSMSRAPRSTTQDDHTLQLSPSSSGEDVAPPKPPRPLNPLQQAKNTLKEAFPSIDPSVVKAVLRASGGSVEPAFNALLEMSDPDAQKHEPAPPPRPPRRPTEPTSTAQSQLAADEQYARQLAEHYNGAAAYGAPRSGSRGRQSQPVAGLQKPGSKQNEAYDDDRERSFIDDDLPVIRDNIKKGFLETQSKVNSWVANLKKKIDGEEDEDFQGKPPTAATGHGGSGPRQPSFGRRSGEQSRRSADHDRYDADPQVLGDDFTNLHLRDDEAPPRRSSRPLANPDLFKPTPPRPQSNAGRRVSFQDGPPEEIGVQQRPTSPPDPSKRRPSGGSGKSNKWQPLAAVDPNPIADHDPFSLGDSDDEEIKKKENKSEDSVQSDQAAAERPDDEVGPANSKNLETQERTGNMGTRDHEAAMLSGKPTV